METDRSVRESHKAGGLSLAARVASSVGFAIIHMNDKFTAASDEGGGALRRVIGRVLLSAVVLVLAACGENPKHASAQRPVGLDTAGLKGDGVDSIGDTFARLKRLQLTSPNPYQDQLVIDCEIQRIVQMYEVNDALRILRKAQSRAIRPTDADAARRVDRSLAQKVFTAEAGCAEFAAEGKLGGPWIPLGGPPESKINIPDSVR